MYRKLWSRVLPTADTLIPRTQAASSPPTLIQSPSEKRRMNNRLFTFSSTSRTTQFSVRVYDSRLMRLSSHGVKRGVSCAASFPLLMKSSTGTRERSRQRCHTKTLNYSIEYLYIPANSDPVEYSLSLTFQGVLRLINRYSPNVDTPASPGTSSSCHVPSVS